MATPTLDAYRRLNPSDTRPDQEIVPDLIGRLQDEGTLQQYPDLLEYAGALDREFRQAHPPGLIKDFLRSAAGGVDTGQAQLFSAAAQFGDVAGLDSVKDWAMRGYRRNLEEAAKNQPSVPSVQDVHSPSEALRYGVGLVGSQVPQLAATAAAATGGAILGTAIGPEGTVGGGLAGLGTFMGAAPGAAAAVGGSTLGLAGAGYLQSQNYAHLAEQHAQDAALTSAVVGSVGGLLMTVVPSDIIRKAFGAEAQSVAKVGVEAILARGEQVVPGITSSMLQAMGKHGANNAVLGVGQELVGMAGELYANRDNPNFQLSDKEITDRILNGAAAGGLIGAAFGATSAKGERLRLMQENNLFKEATALKQKQDEARKEALLKQGATFAANEGAISGLPNEVYEPYSTYAALFDEAADQESKRRAQEAYHSQRELTFRQSEQAAELLRNQLSQQAGGQEINPVNMTPPPGAEPPPQAPVAPEPTGPRPAPAVFHGIQEGVPEAGIPDFPLYNLTEDIEGHPAGSTVSRDTLEKAGFYVPPIPVSQKPRVPHEFTPEQNGPFVSELPRRLIDLANNPRGGITPNWNGEVPAKSLPGILRRLGTSKAEYEVYKDVIDFYTKSKDGKVSLPQLARALEAAAPKVEVKELYPHQRESKDTEAAAAQHRLESQGFRFVGGQVFHPAVYGDEPITHVTRKIVEDYGNSTSADLDRYINYKPSVSESDAATGRYGVEPKPLEQMPGAVDLLVRLPNKLESGWMVHDEKGVPVQPFKTEEEAKKWIGDNPGFSVKKWSKVDFRNPLFEGPHFGNSDKNVLASIRAYREGNTLHVFEVQSDWAQERKRNDERLKKLLEKDQSQIATNLSSGRYIFEDGKLIDTIYGRNSNTANWSVIGEGKTVEEASKNYLQRIRENDHLGPRDHPLLHDYETLAIKAAIDYAQKHGLKKIALSDAETAMMTEMHDRAGIHVEHTKENHELAKKLLNSDRLPTEWWRDGWRRHALEVLARGDEYGTINSEDAKEFESLGFSVDRSVPQEKGMRAAYDERLPNILRKLTGDRGETVDLGQHKNAGLEESSGAPVPGEPMARQPGSPVFRNQFGPKDNITARIFRLDKVKEGQKPMFDGPKINPLTGFAEEPLGSIHQSNYSGPLEFAGDIPAESQATRTQTTETELPRVRKETTLIPSSASKDEIANLAWRGIRTDKTKDETKRLLAVENTKTGKVEVYPVYKSTDNRLRINNGVEDKVGSRRALANVLGLDERYVMRTMREGGSESKALQTVWDELRSGAKSDEFLEEFLQHKEYRPIAFLDALEPVGNKRFEFKSIDDFKSSAYSVEHAVITKNVKLGTAGVEPVINRLAKISPTDSRGVQILASALDQLPVLQDQTEGVSRGSGEFGTREARARSNPNLILSNLLETGDARTFMERLENTTNPNELLWTETKGGKPYLFALFTPEKWEDFKKLTEREDVTPEQILKAIDDGLKDYGWHSRSEYLNAVTPKEGRAETGAPLLEKDAGPSDDNLAAQMVDTGKSGSDVFSDTNLAERFDEGASSAKDINESETSEIDLPEAAKGFAGLSSLEAEALSRAIKNPNRELQIAARNVREAREESTISSPKEDAEFQVVKDDLKKIIETIFIVSRGDVEKPLTDEFLYSIYANLDKLPKDTQPMPSSYRQTNARIQDTFRNTINWLGGQGVDVRLIQQDVNSAVEFLRNEWGRSITSNDGQRMVILSMQDVTRPSRDNLRTLFHEVAHQLFAQEPAYVQRLTHEAIDRLNDLQLDVFSKTYDRRLVNRDPLPPSVLMEEVLAEHLAFTGLNQTVGRTIAQKIIDGFTKLIAQAAMLVGKWTGKVYSPELIKRYAETRFQDVLDRVLNPKTDLDTLSGNIRHTEPYRATFYKNVGGEFYPEKYDPDTGSVVLHDVIDESVLASEFNLDNKLQFSDIVVRDSRADLKKKVWEQEFGLSEKPAVLSDVLQKIAEHPKVTDVELKAAAMSILDRSSLVKSAVIKSVASLEEVKEMTSSHPDSAGMYASDSHRVLINTDKLGGMDHNDFAYLIVHEAAHAAVTRAMDGYKWFNQFKEEAKGPIAQKKLESAEYLAELMDAKTWGNLSEGEKKKWASNIVSSIPHVQKIEKIFKHLQEKNFNKGAYGMSSLDEFAAETMSNRTFQMALAKEKLPDHLRVKREKQSVFASMVELVSRLFNADKRGNALESATSAMEQIMLVADPLSKRREGASSYALPVSQIESDERVRKDFEYEIANLNSQADLYHDLFDKAAANSKTPFHDYLTKILGIFNPEKSLEMIQKRLSERKTPVQVNPDLRLTDRKGAGNKIPAPEDRAQITKRVVESATAAMLKTQAKAGEFKGAIEKQTREIQRVQNRFVKFESMLNDVLSIRDNALATMRKGLRGAERSAARLVAWSARHDGLAGIAAELYRVKDEEAIPEDYADLLVESLDEHTHDVYFTDILTKLTKANVDFDALTPTEIEKEVRAVAAQTRDQQLIDLSDGSPKGKAELALLIYYAKTQPADMAALAIRVEEDPEQKDAILRTIKRIIRSNFTSTEGLNDLFKEVRKGDVRVGKAQRALSEISRQLSQAQSQLKNSTMRAEEMEKAAAALKEGLKPYQADIGIRASRFEPFDGARLIITKPGATALESGTLKLNKASMNDAVKVMMDNKKWLDANKAVHDPTWLAVQDQYEGLKRVAGEHFEGELRHSMLDKFLGSTSDRLEALGISVARQASDRLKRFFSYRIEADHIVQNGPAVSKALDEAMRATGLVKSFQGFKTLFFNPAAHFLRHLQLLPTADLETNRAYAKEQLRQYFMRNDTTREILQKTGGYDKVWELLQKNYDLASSKVAKFAAEKKAFVEDDEVKVVNPRTGVVENAQRPAMDVGLFTTQSDISKVFGVKDLLDHTKGPSGESLWSEWAQTKKLPQDLTKLFTDEAIFHFVKPYIYDTGTLHFSSPEFLDGRTRSKAGPHNVQAAFEASGGDMMKFANTLFDLEYTLKDQGEYVDQNGRRKKFVEDTLGFFRDQYKKIYNMTKAQEQINADIGPYLLSSPMMDNVKAGDFPPEFMDYFIYDEHTLRQVTHNIAAHGALGRDLGRFSKATDENKGILWELHAADKELHAQTAEFARLSEAAKRKNPLASVKEIEQFIEQEVGPDKLKHLKNLKEAQKEIRTLEGNVLGYFSSPNGSTRELALAQTALRFTVSGMLNNFKTTINAASQVFEPFMVYGFNKTAAKQVGRYIESVVRSGFGSFAQAITGEAKLASEYAKFMTDNGLGLDPANRITASQIISDRGKNNMYEDQKMLGWLRKGRSLMFDTGFKGAEGERVAPAFRPWAPFSMMMIATNQGAIESQLRLFNETLRSAMDHMDKTPGARTDPAFEFKHTDIGFAGSDFESLAFDRLKDQFRGMGTTLEAQARELLDARDSGKPLGSIVVSPELARLIAGDALRLMSLPNDVSSAPTWFSNHPVGRMAMPLLTWSVNKTNQIARSFREPTGEISRRAALSAIAAMSLGMVPASMAISLLTDQYDEQILGKKSNLIGYNFDSPSQTAAALIERVGRVGTFGLAGDVVNGVRAYGMDGDLRSLSVDQRVVFLNTMHQVLGLANVLYNQEGTLTYDTFYRPLINALGGGGILQNQQILNNITNSAMGIPLFQHEADTTARLNALNYLRGAGRVTGLDVRTQSGETSLPNPIKPWIATMVAATYGNNQPRFSEAYREAVLAAQEEGKPDAEDYVKRAFESYHPLRIVFKTPPTKPEVAQMFGALTDKGRQDVTNALNMFNSYAATLGIKPYDGKETVQRIPRQLPTAFPSF